MGKERLTSQVFLSNDSWTCPAGVTKVIVYGMGGGAGGNSGNTGYTSSGNYGGDGGMGTSLQPVILDVVPNTTYAITIGQGGTGGDGSLATTFSADPGLAGGDSSFGALMTWYGAIANLFINGGTFNYSFLPNQRPYPSVSGLNYHDAQGGVGSLNGSVGVFEEHGYPGYLGISATAASPTGSSTGGGAGGSGMTGEAIGGAGGAGVNASNGTNGGNATANSGGGGGGGGGGGSTNKAAGSGGDGGSGKIIVMWVE